MGMMGKDANLQPASLTKRAIGIERCSTILNGLSKVAIKRQNKGNREKEIDIGKNFGVESSGEK
jgi:hypothetical protein